MRASPWQSATHAVTVTEAQEEPSPVPRGLQGEPGLVCPHKEGERRKTLKG